MIKQSLKQLKVLGMIVKKIKSSNYNAHSSTHQVGSTNADVHDISDGFPTEAFPLSTAHSLHKRTRDNKN